MLERLFDSKNKVISIHKHIICNVVDDVAKMIYSRIHIVTHLISSSAVPVSQCTTENHTSAPFSIRLFWMKSKWEKTHRNRWFKIENKIGDISSFTAPFCRAFERKRRVNSTKSLCKKYYPKAKWNVYVWERASKREREYSMNYGAFGRKYMNLDVPSV